MQRSPTKWQTEQRDVYRKFVDNETAGKMATKKSSQEDLNQSDTCKCGAPIVKGGEELIANANQQPTLAPQSEEMVSAAQIATLDKDHARKVRINKDAIKKRAQSAKHKVKVDPTRDNYKGPTRWLPDSAFTTYFGKPVFHPYGNANTRPTNGGNVYGQYMLSHNVNP
jgi:hypothetical protein